MDAFYAACEEQRHPEFRGRPLIVGADPRGGRGRGVVVASNYAARAFGVRSAMPIGEAWRRAPNAAYVAPQHSYYSEVGRRIFDDLACAFSIDRVSIDEAFLEPPAGTAWDGAAKFAAGLHERVERATGGLTCSVGVGPNRLIAKIASGHRKPNGTTIVAPNDVQGFLDPLPVRDVPYIGPKTSQRLGEMGIRTVLDLRGRARGDLIAAFGQHGGYMHEAAHGRDESPIMGGPRQEQSISHEETFEEDTRDRGRMLSTLRRMMDGLERELRSAGYWYRTVALKIRYSDFATLTRQASLHHPSRDTEAARRFVPRLLAGVLLDPRPVRLIGLRLGSLSALAGQRTLEEFAATHCQ